MDFGDKVALVTGGAIGLGFAYAKELLRNGVKHVAIADLESSSGGESAKKLNAEFGKGRAIFVVCDVTKASEFEAAFAKTVKEFGGLDILVNNAGIFNEPLWESMIDVNMNGLIRGTFLGLQWIGKNKRGKGGVIVNIASIFGLDPLAWGPVYTATKYAVVGLSRSLGTPYHLEKTGVRIVTMCPGITETQLVAEVPIHLTELADTDVAMADINTYPLQKVENVAHGMVHIVRSGKNGSVWIAEGEEPVIEVSIPDRFALKAAAK